MAKTDYYQILGIGKNASKENIKKAYRKKALEFHPDKNKSADAEEKFKKVNEAYEVLSDPEKKQAYDQFGHRAFDPSRGGSAAGPGGFGQGRTYRSGPFSYTYYSGEGSPFEGFDFGGFSDPFEIFESFFGGASPFRQQKAKPRYRLTIDFMEAIEGAEKKVKIDGKEHKIKIPPGSQDGTRISYQDFDVIINIRSHEQFRREGSDIFVDHKIPFGLAALGGTTQVPTVNGKLKLKIRPGTQSGSLIRLRGEGAPQVRGKGRGDQYIRLLVEVPKNLTSKQKKLLKELEETLEK